jgi:hypothetical protein
LQSGKKGVLRETSPFIFFLSSINKIDYYSARDNEANLTLTGNTTLTLKEGPHKITIYATDTAGNMVASETVYFTIEQVFPTIPVAAGIATTAIVSLGFLVYFKKIAKALHKMHDRKRF